MGDWFSVLAWND